MPEEGFTAYGLPEDSRRIISSRAEFPVHTPVGAAVASVLGTMMAAAANITVAIVLRIRNHHLTVGPHNMGPLLGLC